MSINHILSHYYENKVFIPLFFTLNDAFIHWFYCLTILWHRLSLITNSRQLQRQKSVWLLQNSWESFRKQMPFPCFHRFHYLGESTLRTTLPSIWLLLEMKFHSNVPRLIKTLQGLMSTHIRNQAHERRGLHKIRDWKWWMCVRGRHCLLKSGFLTTWQVTYGSPHQTDDITSPKRFSY